MTSLSTPSLRSARPVYPAALRFDSAPFRTGPFSRLIRSLDQAGIKIPKDIEILHMDGGDFIHRPKMPAPST